MTIEEIMKQVNELTNLARNAAIIEETGYEFEIEADQENFALALEKFEAYLRAGGLK